MHVHANMHTRTQNQSFHFTILVTVNYFRVGELKSSIETDRYVMLSVNVTLNVFGVKTTDALSLTNSFMLILGCQTSHGG